MKNHDKNIGVYYNKKDYAGFFKRTIIAVIDLSVIFVIATIAVSVNNYLMNDDKTLFRFNAISILTILILYMALLKRSKYRTLGYIIAGVKIVNLKGEKPSVFQMISRLFLFLLGPIGLIIDIIWLTSETTKQTLRDKYVGTYVINKNASPAGEGPLQSVNIEVLGWRLFFREVKVTKNA